MTNYHIKYRTFPFLGGGYDDKKEKPEPKNPEDDKKKTLVGKLTELIFKK